VSWMDAIWMDLFVDWMDVDVDGWKEGRRSRKTPL
jgi:hypothetical protein